MKERAFLVSSFLLLFVISAGPSTLGAATLYVGSGPGDYPTIQLAVVAAVANDTVLIRTGTYVEFVIVDDYVIPGESGSGPQDRTGLTIREAPGDSVVVTSPETWGDIFQVTANGITIEGLDIFGATYGGLTSILGIHLSGADDCVIRDNRCGWDPLYKTNFGIYLSGEANNNVLEGNICSYSDNVGIYLHGSDYNLIVSNTCNYSRNFYGSEEGIRLYASTFNAISDNTCNGNPRGIELAYNDWFNTVTGNTCVGNSRGIYLSQGYWNNISANTISDNTNGIWVTSSTYTQLAMNSVSGSVEYGINLTWAWYVQCYLNDLSDNISGNIYVDSGTDNIYQSPVKLSCFHGGAARKMLLGNHYDDYAGSDGDGDGIGDTAHNGGTFTDDAPLMNAPASYLLETWYLGDQEMYGNQLSRTGGRREIPPTDSVVWVADSPAVGDVTFPAGAAVDQTNWTFHLSVEEHYHDPAGNLTLALGHAEGNGSDFTTVAGQPSTGLSGTGNFYSGAFDNVQAFTVPSGRHLALRIDNADPVDSLHIMTGGCWSCISSPHPAPGYGSGSGLTVSCDLACSPASGTVPFTTAMSVDLVNAEPDRPATRVHARIDVQLAAGGFFPNWKAGMTNINKGGSYHSGWVQSIPGLGSVIGENLFTLVGTDITPSPYNLPPYMPSGDITTSVCTVTAAAP